MNNDQLIEQLAYIARLALVAHLQENSDSSLADAQQQIEEVTAGETLIELWARVSTLD